MKTKKLTLLIAILMFVISIQIPVFAEIDQNNFSETIDEHLAAAHTCDVKLFINPIDPNDHARCFTGMMKCIICGSFKMDAYQFHNFDVNVYQNYIINGVIGRLITYSCKSTIPVNNYNIPCGHYYSVFTAY